MGGADGRGEFDQIASFRRFLLFARDTIHRREPMDPDIHWSAMSGHVATFISNGGRYDRIIALEAFESGMQSVLDAAGTPVPVDLTRIPRFNESESHGPPRAHPVAEYLDDLAMHLMHEIYRTDFRLFRYDFENPANSAPLREIDLDEVHEAVGG